MGIGTKCVQDGYRPGNGEPRQIPIIQSTTFKYDTSQDMESSLTWRRRAISIPRLQNPTNDYVAGKDRFAGRRYGGYARLHPVRLPTSMRYSISHPVAITWWHPRLSTAGPIICLP